MSAQTPFIPPEVYRDLVKQGLIKDSSDSGLQQPPSAQQSSSAEPSKSFNPSENPIQGPGVDPYYETRIQELMIMRSNKQRQQERSSARGPKPPPPTRAPTLPVPPTLPVQPRDRRPRTPLNWDHQRTRPSEVQSASAAAPAANIPGSSGVDAQSLSERLQELSTEDADSRQASNAQQPNTIPYYEAPRRPERYERTYPRYEPHSRLPTSSNTLLGGAPSRNLNDWRALQQPVETSDGRVVMRRNAFFSQ